MKCRVLKEEDYADVADLLSNVMGGSPESWQNRFNHWWKQNPAYSENMECGWVLETEEKDIVGFNGIIPRLFKLGNEQVLSGISTSASVEKKYRHYSLKLFQTSFLETRFPILFGVGMDIRLYPLHVRFGFKKIPISSFGRLSIWVLNPENFLKSALIYKGISSVLSNLISWLGGLPLSIVSRLRFNRKALRNSRLQIEKVTKCGPAFDSLWDRVSKYYSATSLRTAECLNWCYGVKNNGVSKFTMLACVENESILGYAVYRILESRRLQIKRLQIVDIFVEHDREDVVLALLDSIIDAGCKLSATTVEITCGIDWIEQVLRSTGPFIWKNPVAPPIYRLKDSMMSTKLEDAKAWHFTEYDGDIVL